jgi:UrcA family protein
MKLFNNTVAGTFALVATFVTVAVATPLNAAEPVGVAVAYGDLNLSNEADAAKLDSRIRQAAYQVCSQADTAIRAATCRQDVIGNARAKLAMADKNEVKLAAR